MHAHSKQTDNFCRCPTRSFEINRAYGSRAAKPRLTSFVRSTVAGCFDCGPAVGLVKSTNAVTLCGALAGPTQLVSALTGAAVPAVAAAKAWKGELCWLGAGSVLTALAAWCWGVAKAAACFP